MSWPISRMPSAWNGVLRSLAPDLDTRLISLGTDR